LTVAQRDAGFLRHIGESPVVIVSVEAILPKVPHKKIGPAVIVEISH
jgi:hypothetical protein